MSFMEPVGILVSCSALRTIRVIFYRKNLVMSVYENRMILACHRVILAAKMSEQAQHAC